MRPAMRRPICCSSLVPAAYCCHRVKADRRRCCTQAVTACPAISLPAFWSSTKSRQARQACTCSRDDQQMGRPQGACPPCFPHCALSTCLVVWWAEPVSQIWDSLGLLQATPLCTVPGF